MIIKSMKETRNYIILLMIVGIIICIKGANLCFVERKEYLFLFIFFILPLVYSTRTFVSYCRTFKMDETGCEVVFFGYKREYLWEEFQTKQIITYGKAWGDINPYKKGVLFSAKQIKKPKWIKTREYSCFFHPWSIIYVDFALNITRKNRRILHTYEVDEDVFIEMMKKWNVELEEI